eukprot:6689961-Prymnesium_polylepis.1
MCRGGYKKSHGAWGAPLHVLGGEVLVRGPRDGFVAQLAQVEDRSRPLVERAAERALRDVLAHLDAREREEHLLELHAAVAQRQPRVVEAVEHCEVAVLVQLGLVDAERRQQLAQQHGQVVARDVERRVGVDLLPLVLEFEHGRLVDAQVLLRRRVGEVVHDDADHQVHHQQRAHQLVRHKVEHRDDHAVRAVVVGRVGERGQHARLGAAKGARHAARLHDDGPALGGGEAQREHEGVEEVGV